MKRLLICALDITHQVAVSDCVYFRQELFHFLIQGVVFLHAKCGYHIVRCQNPFYTVPVVDLHAPVAECAYSAASNLFYSITV